MDNNKKEIILISAEDFLRIAKEMEAEDINLKNEIAQCKQIKIKDR